MHRTRHTVDDTDASGPLLQASMDPLEQKLQLERERVELEAAAAISARRLYACRVVAAGLGVLFVLLFFFKAVSESSDQKRAYSSSCMHALGGGPVGPRGSLLHFDPRCTEELKEYFDKAYYAEVRRVSDQAIQYFRQQLMRHQQQEAASGLAAGGSRGTVVFDIDETALSNMDGFFGDRTWTRFIFGGASATRCVRPHLEYSALEPLRLKVAAYQDPAAATSATAGSTGVSGGGSNRSSITISNGVIQTGNRRPLCNSPPLRATLDLYNFLYDNNFTVVFLTGRSEDARAETEANLAEAGYGRKCSPPPAGSTANAAATITAATAAFSSMTASDTSGSVRRASTHRALLQQKDPMSESQALSQSQANSNQLDPITTASSSLAASLPFAGLFAPPDAPPPQRCYSELLMRQMGDERLASVFKAEARGRLVAAGRTLMGSIGDQFSDLVGEAEAVANFKLPNPVYTLL